ncbi:MAG: hypothetical protein ACU0CA_03930 [Paracoccaceae bacterium]
MENKSQTPAPIKQPRISVKLRKAINLRIRQGMSISRACEKASISEAGYYKAMKRPAVLEHHEDVKNRFVSEVEAQRASYKARAFEVAMDLMGNAKSETIRARMAEFLASEGKGASANVAVQVNNNAAGGYEYVRPGQTVVEIEGEPVEPTPVPEEGISLPPSD